MAFEFAQVGGITRIEPVWTADCARHEIGPGGVASPIGKSGAVSGDEPDAQFRRSFLLGGPEVRLPPGQWTITAIAIFSEAPDCSAPSHELRATARIGVTN